MGLVAKQAGCVVGGVVVGLGSTTLAITTTAGLGSVAIAPITAGGCAIGSAVSEAIFGGEDNSDSSNNKKDNKKDNKNDRHSSAVNYKIEGMNLASADMGANGVTDNITASVAGAMQKNSASLG